MDCHVRIEEHYSRSAVKLQALTHVYASKVLLFVPPILTSNMLVDY